MNIYEFTRCAHVYNFYSLIGKRPDENIKKDEIMSAL